MNGYEGDLKEHLKRNPDALFRTQRSSSLSSTLTPNPLLSYNSGHRQSYSPSLPYPPPSEPSTTQPRRTPGIPSYTGAALATIYGSGQNHATQSGHQSTTTPTANNMTASNVWERKDPTSLHPAIRQEYGGMFHHQYQPPLQLNHSTQQSSGTPPSAYKPPVMSSPSQGLDPSPQTPASMSSQIMQQERPTSKIPTNAVEPPPSQQSIQTENKQPLYAHQQYFQNAQHQNKPVMQPQSQTREVPDVPADSTSLIEKLMANLREASRHS